MLLHPLFPGSNLLPVVPGLCFGRAQLFPAVSSCGSRQVALGLRASGRGVGAAAAGSGRAERLLRGFNRRQQHLQRVPRVRAAVGTPLGQGRWHRAAGDTPRCLRPSRSRLSARSSAANTHGKENLKHIYYPQREMPASRGEYMYACCNSC